VLLGAAPVLAGAVPRSQKTRPGQNGRLRPSKIGSLLKTLRGHVLKCEQNSTPPGRSYLVIFYRNAASGHRKIGG
jgi:hypothetical protein